MEVEFVWVGWVGGGVQSHFRVKPNLVEVELGLWQYEPLKYDIYFIEPSVYVWKMCQAQIS